jgi:hypothetical protein
MTEGIAKVKALPLPDLSDIFYIVILCFMLFMRPDTLLSDGSTGWHLVVGNFILDKGVIPHTDMLSYTFFGKPWLDFEWFADVSMALLVKLGGLNLLNVVAASLIAFLVVLLYHRCRKTGCHFILAIILTLLGGVASSLHWLARPHLLTFFGVYLFSTKLEDFSKGAISGNKLLVYLSLCMLIWVNCHGGFLVGFGVTGIYLLCYLVQSVVVGPSEKKKMYQNGVKWLSLTLFATFAASLCNPYFLELYSWLFMHLKQKTIINLTNEYASPVFHGDIACISLALLFALFVIGGVITTRPLSPSQLVSSLSFAYLSLVAMRHFPLFVIVVLPQIAQMFSKTIFAPDQDKGIFQLLSNRVQGILRSFDNWNIEFTENEKLCRLHLLPIIVFAYFALASLNGGKALGQTVIHTTFDEAHMPTTTLKEIRNLKLDPKQGLNYDNWGGYLSYQLGIPVFIDDRVPLYGESFYLEYASVFDVGPQWKDVLKKYGIKWIIMPNDSRIVSALKANPDWKLAAQDNSSSLFVGNDNKVDSLEQKSN